MERFNDKIAFITGAGGYIGGTTARMLATEGCVTGQTWAITGGRGLGMKGSD